MTKEDFMYEFLQGISLNTPQNAVELRKASENIISKWINLKFEYPHKLIDNFVYIESSIERLIEEKINDPAKSTREYTKRYNFHIESFIESLLELRSFVEECRSVK